MLLSLHDVSYAPSGAKPLFEHVELDIGRQRHGLVGRNGVGKTSMLGLLAGTLLPTSGQIQSSARVRMLLQEQPADIGRQVSDAFAARPMLEMSSRVERGDIGSDYDLSTVDWTLPARLQRALDEVGLTTITADTPVARLSGGERTRLALAALVFDAPDVLLLDEPTNHLDREGRRVVGALLERWNGGAVVVSHDRELLRGMDSIIGLTGIGVRLHGGGWDLYAQQRAIALSAAEHQLADARRTLADTERGVQQARERKARRDGNAKRERGSGSQAAILLDRKAERAQRSLGSGSRLASRLLEDGQARVQQARSQLDVLKPLKLQIPGSGLPAGRDALRIDAASAGGHLRAPVLREISLLITGANGSGKSTLLRLAAGLLSPFSGHVQRLLPSALLDQHVSLLDPATSLPDNFQRLHPQVDTFDSRNVLASFLFRADDALKPVGVLSGGERLRAGLAWVLGAGIPPALLLLDEPSNHLDLDALEAIEAGLNAYDGALLVVSHDEAFLDAIGVQQRLLLLRGPTASGMTAAQAASSGRRLAALAPEIGSQTRAGLFAQYPR